MYIFCWDVYSLMDVKLSKNKKQLYLLYMCRFFLLVSWPQFSIKKFPKEGIICNETLTNVSPWRAGVAYI